jgi:hypothetical protein
MQAVELEATVDDQHRIHVDMPDIVPPGKARLIVLFEPLGKPAGERVFGQFRGMGHVPDDFDAPLPDEFWVDAAL